MRLIIIYLKLNLALKFMKKFEFRPIFPTHNTRSFKVAEFLVPHLAKIIKNVYSIMNYFRFWKEISDLPISKSHSMASVHIVNFLINFPLNETNTLIFNLFISYPLFQVFMIP